MNSYRLHLSGIILLALIVTAPCRGGIFINDATITNLPWPFDPADNYFTLTESSGGFGLFAILVTDQGSGLYDFSYSGIAQEYALYSATSGTVITALFALSTTPLVSNNGIDPGSATLAFTPGESKYVGYWDDRPPLNNDPDIGDNYGWALLTWDGTTLSVTDSATAVGGGIIVGSYTQVPEPSSAALIIFSFILMAAGGRFLPEVNKNTY